MKNNDSSLIGGMDVSGTMDNYKYLGIVIGQKQNLDSLYRKIGSPQRHMSGQRKKQKEKIIKNLEFDQFNRTAFCVKINRKSVINTVKNKRNIKHRRMSGGKLFALFEKTLFKYLTHEIEKFTLQYDLGAKEIIVECDTDSIVFAKTWGVKHLGVGTAHIISDIVAWCNNKNQNISGVIEIDLSKKIQNELLRKLSK